MPLLCYRNDTAGYKVQLLCLGTKTSLGNLEISRIISQNIDIYRVFQKSPRKVNSYNSLMCRKKITNFMPYGRHDREVFINTKKFSE